MVSVPLADGDAVRCPIREDLDRCRELRIRPTVSTTAEPELGEVGRCGVVSNGSSLEVPNRPVVARRPLSLGFRQKLGWLGLADAGFLIAPCASSRDFLILSVSYRFESCRPPAAGPVADACVVPRVTATRHL